MQVKYLESQTGQAMLRVSDS